MSGECPNHETKAVLETKKKKKKKRKRKNGETKCLLFIFNHCLFCKLTQVTGVLWKTSLQRSSTVQLCQSPTTHPGSRPSLMTRPWLTLSSQACLNLRLDQTYQGTRVLTGNKVESKSLIQYRWLRNEPVNICYFKWALNVFLLLFILTYDDVFIIYV